MFGHYIDLALRSFKRNRVLTTLMIVTLGIGIGASMTTLTVVHLLAGDPLPQKSARLFYPQIDPGPADGYIPGQTKPQWTMTYVDAMNLLHAHQALRQAAMATARFRVANRAEARPVFDDGVMTTSDFFAMFDVPFQYGGSWSAGDDDARASVVVIADFLNQKLFGGVDSVGKIIRVNDHDFRVVGVIKHWAPHPHFYAQGLAGPTYVSRDAVFIPLQTMRAVGIKPQTYNCFGEPDQRDLFTSPCTWLGFWVEFADPSDAGSYKTFLANYVQQQIAMGRFSRPETDLRDLNNWLRYTQIVPDDVRLQAGLAFGFLLICIVNTIGLLLAKCLRRSPEVGVRRALGATRGAIFAQFMVEAGMIGLAGGILGLFITILGLRIIRHQPAEYASMVHLDVHTFVFTFVVALVASLIAGLLPAWRVSAVAPAPQLKAG